MDMAWEIIEGLFSWNKRRWGWGQSLITEISNNFFGSDSFYANNTTIK